ncbi:hypothetical protein RJ641_033782 [Dillenia turbinata]|uniref:Transmembrane protein n=1 Tax=Dillenia turbinata TaxID=194707 RepID=A0AAN8ZGD4_9MAGN
MATTRELLYRCYQEMESKIQTQEFEIRLHESTAHKSIFFFLAFQVCIFYTICHKYTFLYPILEALILYSLSRSSTLSSLQSSLIVIYLISHYPSVELNQYCWWVPLTISLFSDVLFFSVFYDTMLRLYRARVELNLFRLKKWKIFRKICGIEREDFVGEELIGVKSLVGIWVLSLIFFSAIMLYSCVSIPCDGDGQLEVLLELLMGHWSFKKYSGKLYKCRSVDSIP